MLVAFLLVNAPKCLLSLVLASVVQGDAVNCNTMKFVELLLNSLWRGAQCSCIVLRPALDSGTRLMSTIIASNWS